MKKIYTFDPATCVIAISFSHEDEEHKELTPILIDISNDTITYDGIITPLDGQHVYTLLDVTKNLIATPALMDALLESNYYVNVFLPYSLGKFNTPVEDSVLYMFSSFILPYEILYRELANNPDYKQRILVAYDKNHSVFIRQFKETIRLILVIPGLVCTPLILLMILPALNRMT